MGLGGGGMGVDWARFFEFLLLFVFGKRSFEKGFFYEMFAAQSHTVTLARHEYYSRYTLVLFDSTIWWPPALIPAIRCGFSHENVTKDPLPRV